jgi:ketosteroid isomerase-like protein
LGDDVEVLVINEVAVQIRDIHNDFRKHLDPSPEEESGDLDALVALYEPQACLTPEPGQVVTGTQAIREALSNFLATKPKLTLETKTVNQSSDIALIISNWHLTGIWI